MLSFSQYLILLEGKADDLRQQHPHLSGLSDRHLVKYGPALSRFADVPKDVNKVASTLNNFDKHGSKLEGKLKDFGQHPSFEHVQQHLQPHVEKTETKKTETETAKSGAPVVFDNGEGLKVRHIQTPEAAQGPHCKDTKWCVTSKGETGREHFHNYSKGGRNKMYVIHTPDGKRFAYHEGEEAIARDEKDGRVHIADIVKQHPDLQKSKVLQNSKWGAFFGDEKKIEKLKQKAKSNKEENRMFAAKHPAVAPHLIEDESYFVRQQVATHPEHAGKMVNDPTPRVRVQVAKHPEHAGKMVNDESSMVRSTVAQHPEHAGKLINDPNPKVRVEVAKHPEHAGNLIHDQSISVRTEVAQHPEHAGKMVNDESWMVRSRVAKHTEHAGKLVNDPHTIVRNEVAKHTEHAGKLVKDEDWTVRQEVASHPEHAGKLVKDKHFIVRATVAKHLEHAGKLVNDPHARVRTQVATHPEHAGKLVNDEDYYVRTIVAKHPEHAGKLLKDKNADVRQQARETLGMK